MSITRFAHREGGAKDVFETPWWATRAILPRVLPPEGLIIEPAAGEGAIVSELIEYGVPPGRIGAMELREESAAALGAFGLALVRCPRDSLAWFREHPIPPQVSLVITNPPFALPAEKRSERDGLAMFARVLVEQAPAGTRIVLLGRLTWAAPSRDRHDWLTANRPDIYVLSRRPAFIRIPRCTLRGCKWRAPVQALSDTRPAVHTESRYDGQPSNPTCPNIGREIAATTSSDADEYAWFVWTKASTAAPTWGILSCPSGREGRREPRAVRNAL